MTRPWYESAFESEYLTLYAHRTDEAAAREVEWTAQRLTLERGGLLLDLACGNGRHAAALAARGFRVVGLDYSADLIRSAASRRDAGLVGFLRGDMRRLPFGRRFAAVTSFFTSFGYFAEEAEDRAVVAEVARVLRPGGRYLVDFLNAPEVRAGLVPESREEREGWRLEQRRSISPDGRRVEKRVTIQSPDGATREYTESVRLYEQTDFERMFQDCGLETSAVFGDLTGAAWSADAPRLVVEARPR